MNTRGRIDVATAEQTTGVPARTIYRWVNEARLTVVKMRGRIMLAPAELDELIARLRDRE